MELVVEVEEMFEFDHIHFFDYSYNQLGYLVDEQVGVIDKSQDVSEPMIESFSLYYEEVP